MTDTNNATTISDDLGEQESATVKSVLVTAPDEFVEAQSVTMDEARKFQIEINKDEDRIEAKKTGAVVSNYYHGRLQMLELSDWMRQEFPQTHASKFKIVENFVKSTSRQLSTIYKQSAVREAINKRNKDASPESLEDDTKVINFIYEFGDLNRSFQEIERHAKWAKTVLIKVMFQSKTGKITLKPYSPQFYDVMVSDSGVLQAVIISDFMAGTATKKENSARRYWIYTDDEIQEFRGDKLKPVGALKKNELGRLPFVLFNDDLPVENEKPYLHADSMMSNTNLAINTKLTDAMSLTKNKTYGQPWIIGGDKDKLPNFSGHEEIWHIVQGKGDDHAPTVGILHPSGDLESLLTLIERLANGYATSRGLAPDTFTAVKTGTGASSGIALKIKNHVLIEMRDSEEAKYMNLENEIFDLIRAIHNFNTDVKGGTDLPPISDDVKLSVHFDDNSLAFENPVEIRSQQLTEVNQGLLKRTDFVRASRPHFDEAEALQYLKDVEEQNKDLNVVPTMDALDKALSTNDSE